ncbi:P-loop containing nucleoside triphosphate hydrolase protein [Glomus cerebriforme]|uniref:P-loop containing nucleoside triphosphate hydrolase protein n=1 Tax=Glomus cerebriforme TaxID=658196 RepID=A0A397T6X0_9GLOM|nr:P-loop containing nucleoside triphosphate hydrolase protein [Glomus cerebriforme]
MAYYFRRRVLPFRLVTRLVMFLQPQKFALRKSNPVLFQSLLLRSYTNSLPNGPSEKLTSAVVLDKYLSKVEKALKTFFFVNSIGFMIFISGDLLYAWYLDSCNESLLNETMEKGTRPDVGIKEDELVPRPVVIERLKKILLPRKDQSFYYVVCGEHGTGKTVLTRIASREVGEDKKRGIQGGRGVIYVDIPPNDPNVKDFDEEFGEAFGKALNFKFEENISFSAQLMKKYLVTPADSKPKWKRALKAFKRASAVYKKTNPCHQPPVIVYDNISHIDPGILDYLQDDAKKSADGRNYITVFVCSEGSVPRRMESRSAWSRAKAVIEIGDLSEEESMKYLTEKRKINEVDTKKIYELVGGRIIDLKDVADDFLAKKPFEDTKGQILAKVKQKFESAKLLRNQTHHEAGKGVIDALLKSKEINTDVFREFFKDAEEYSEVLKANVFAYHPSRDTGIVSLDQQGSLSYY